MLLTKTKIQMFHWETNWEYIYISIGNILGGNLFQIPIIWSRSPSISNFSDKEGISGMAFDSIIPVHLYILSRHCSVLYP